MTPITSLLRKEHRHVLGKLSEFERALGDYDLSGIRNGLNFLVEDLVPHRRKEEEILFPMLGRHIGTEVGPVACMLEEHQEEGEILRRMRAALDEPDGPDARERVRAAGHDLVYHLRAHIFKEDTVLFPMVEGMLTEVEKEEARARMESVGPCCPERAEAQATAPAAERGGTNGSPDTYREFVARHPLLERAWNMAREAEKDGPLDGRTIRLVKLGTALGACREGAVRSAARKARAEGATDEELRQVVALAASTIGFPSAVAVECWIRAALTSGQRE